MILIDTKNGIKTVTGESHRLIWMGNQHITTIDGTTKSKTWTKHEVEEFTEAKPLVDRIEKLGLTLQINEIMCSKVEI